MTYHLLFPALALLLTAATLSTWVQSRTITQAAYAAVHTGTTRSPMPGHGFGAFGNGEALRNLLYVN